MSYKSVTILKNEPDILTVPDVIRILKFGKNLVYDLIKNGHIGSIKMGRKIIIPKTCLIEFLKYESSKKELSLFVPVNRWTYETTCDNVDIARESKV